MTSAAERARLALTFPPGAALVAGSGNIGGAVTRKLALAGVPVVFTYRSNTGRAQSIQREIVAGGGAAHPLQLEFAEARSQLAS